MKRLLLRLIRGYQRQVSPQLGPSCRFVPTCSQYAIEALESYGVLRGLILSIWRILRCNPLSKGGYDRAGAWGSASPLPLYTTGGRPRDPEQRRGS